MVRRSKKKKFSIFLFIRNIIYFLLLMVFYFAVFIKREFNDVSYEQLMYTFKNTEGANYDIVFNGIIFVLGFSLITWGIILFIKKILCKINISVSLNLEFKGKKLLKFDVFKVNRFRQIVCFIIIIYLGIWIPNNMIGYNSYVKTQKKVSGFFENYYVNPKNVNISFNNGKRNLVYIFVESLESSNVSSMNGGYVEKSYIPNLENYALNNINFSHNDSIGGFVQLKNTEWTVAGLLAQTSGIPLKIPVDGNEYDSSVFMPGAYSIGQVLAEHGYKNYFLLGSDAKFGSRRNYFEQHGDYEILDYYWAIDSNLISKDYFQWWGYEDQKLFNYAKNKLLEISKNDEPFNFTMLTADTHFIDGYMDGSCSKPFTDKYANSFHCSDSKIYQFIEWIKQQDFYKDTTIVIVGDHLTMQSDFYDIDPTSSRYVFNTFINSAITTNNSKNRLLSHFDIYPTTLAAMGATIEGNKLALGVNLFSNEATLIEKLGIDEVNEKLSNKSNYYNEYLLGDSYQEMLDKLVEEEKQANIEKCGKEVCDEIEGELEIDSNSENNVEDKGA